MTCRAPHPCPALLLTALVAIQPLGPAMAVALRTGAPSAPDSPVLSQSEETQQKKKKKNHQQQQGTSTDDQQRRQDKQQWRQKDERRDQEQQRQDKETKQKYKKKYDQKYQDQLDQDKRDKDRQRETKQHYKDKYKDKYEDKYRNKYRRNMERSRYAPGYRADRRYDWNGWDRNRWYSYNRNPAWNPWTRPVAYNAYNPYPQWAQPGWYNSRPWDTGWYGGWSSPPWGWWGGQSVAWGLASLATTAIINRMIDEAVQQRQPSIVMPNSNWRLVYGTVEPRDIGNVTFVASNGSNSYQLTADCNEGLLDGRVPYQADQAQLLNAACQVAYGTYANAGYDQNGPYRPSSGPMY
ncbi:MAG: hypothetical protein VKM01_02380 [Cyanobacteriota bacterium]|nr:hypothetical protein [Cyanobacteriota bacterium]